MSTELHRQMVRLMRAIDDSYSDEMISIGFRLQQILVNMSSRRAERDFQVLVSNIERNPNLNSDEKRVLMPLTGMLAQMIQGARRERQIQAFEIARETALTTREQARVQFITEQQNELRREVMYSLTGGLAVGAMTGAAAYATSKIPGAITSAARSVGDWFRTPLGYCAPTTTEVIEKGFLGLYDSVKTITTPPESIVCGWLDSMSNGISGLASTADNLTYAALLWLIVALMLMTFFAMLLGFTFRRKKIKLGGLISFEYGKAKKHQPKKPKSTSSARRTKTKPKNRRR